MKDLVKRLKNKEEAALKEVMAMYKNKIFNYLYLMLGEKETAEEITQDTFVKVYFKAGTLKTDNLKAWIYAIATNLARTQLRKTKIKRTFSLSAVNQGDLSHNLSYNPSPQNRMELEQLLAVLPEKYRAALIMKDINNFSFEEMAQILKKPVGTVKAIVFRGRRRMRFHLLAVENGGSHG
ncbi:MAG: RNA polymerase sigma factor [Planctomycetota bacterium]|jgi:RNA polymerase sigma-70 factor (ECF subfamily)